jgi:hypothetical protein
MHQVESATPHAATRFELHITSLADFIAFVAVIRDDDVEDAEKLAAMLTKLRTSTDREAAAVAAAEPPPT